MTALETLRDTLNEQLTVAKAHLDALTALRDGLEAEIVRVPSVADVKALVAKIP